MQQLLLRPLGGTQLDPEGNGAGLCRRARLRIIMDLLEVEQLVQFIFFDKRGLGLLVFVDLTRLRGLCHLQPFASAELKSAELKLLS